MLVQVAAEGKRGQAGDRQQRGQARGRTDRKQDRRLRTGDTSAAVGLSSKFKFKENTKTGNYTCPKSLI